MRIPDWLRTRLFQWMIVHVALARDPDFIVGADAPGGAYLYRWYLTPWRRWQSRFGDRARATGKRRHAWIAAASRLLPNLYLHHFLRDDDARALHDHPSIGVSLILSTGYLEHTIGAGGIHRRTLREPGQIRVLRAGGPRELGHAHRIELLRGAIGTPRSCWTLFWFGPTVREWGFHCPHRGWVHWRDFTAEGRPGEVGPGCD